MTTFAKRVPWIGGALVVLAAASAFVVGPYGPLGLAGVLLAVVAVGAVTRYTPGARPRVVVEEAAVEEGEVSLLPWIIAAIGVRWLAALALNLSPLWRQFAPDAVFYTLAGEAIRESWSSPNVDLALWFGKSKAIFYPYLNAISHAVFGSSRYPLSFLNGVIAVAAAYNYGLLARRMYGPRAQRIAFMLSAFFPSLIIWTSMNIRESWSYFALSLVLLGADQLRQRVSVSSLGIMLSGLVLLSVLRAYLIPLVGTGLVLSFLVVRMRQLPYALMGLAVVVGAFVLFGDALGVTGVLGDDPLERVNVMRHQLAFGGSAYGSDVDTSTPMGALTYLPLGISRFLLSPFPWNISSWRQLIALPESIAFAYVLYYGIREAIRTGWRESSKGALLIFVLAVTVCAYGLASGNEGTAYRHRGQIVFMVFVLAGGAFTRRRSS
ncbi:MAG: hypothetical protein RMA76_02380 [Deltaproteobacteria bacterium]|jgi:hypothetical protein